MKNLKISQMSIAAATVALTVSWSGLAIAQGPSRDSSEDSDREKPTAASFIERLDKDGDGKVSKDEFDGPDDHFTKSDKNNDGYISEDEAPTGPPPGQNGQQGGGRQGGGRR